MSSKNLEKSRVNVNTQTDWEQAMTAFKSIGTLAEGDIPASVGDGFITVSFNSGKGFGDETRSRLRRMAWAAMARRLPVSKLHFADGGLWVNFTDSVVPCDLFQVWELWKELGGGGSLAVVCIDDQKVMGPVSLHLQSQDVKEKTR